MKECLYCKKEFEGKKPTRKFCSDSCRVMYSRKYGKKDAIKPIQMQVMYNALLDLIENAKNYGLPKDYQEVKQIGILRENGTIQPILKTFQQHMNEISELQFEDEYRKKYAEIEAADNISEKQKQLLYQNMKTTKL